MNHFLNNNNIVWSSPAMYETPLSWAYNVREKSINKYLSHNLVNHIAKAYGPKLLKSIWRITFRNENDQPFYQDTT
ncbi:uncharacterized protein DS421_17g574480 [Arachis hypogaea]|nr:uncharacterized protein DS421_17g574480 [Arachis hypogaea]